jgi:DNA-binding transcriptional MerR regulator
MLLKISLVLAILVGAATLFFTGSVKQKIDDQTARANAAETAQKTAEDKERTARNDAKKSKEAFENASKELNQATNVLGEVTKNLAIQQKRADKASTDLVGMTEERNQARQELNQWTALGFPIDKVREQLAQNKQLTTERAAMQTENKTLLRRSTELQARLDRYERPEDREVPLPAGTKGKVVAVDPKYDFVVLDIGANQQLVEGAKMLVNRDGRLVAKVKITRVEQNRAIANIMPEWKQDEVLEGDQVVY